MSDITQKVQILIGGDASQAKKVIQEVENELKASKQRQQNQARSQVNEHGNMGRDAADRFGREYNRAQDRWLGVASQGFRKYGGTIGSIIAEVIEQFDSLERAAKTSERLERRWGEGGTKMGSGAAHIGSEVAGAAGTVGGVQHINQKIQSKSFFNGGIQASTPAIEPVTKSSFFKDIGAAVVIGAVVGAVAYGIEKWIEWRAKVKEFTQEFSLTNAEARKFVALGSELNNEKGIVKYLTNLVDLLEKAKDGAPEAVRGLKELGILSPYVTTGQATEAVEKKIKETKSPVERDLLAIRAKMGLDIVDKLTGGPDDSQKNVYKGSPSINRGMRPYGAPSTDEAPVMYGPEYTKEIRMLLAKQAARLKGDDELMGRISEQMTELYKDGLEFEKDKIAIVESEIEDLKEKQSVEWDLNEYTKRSLEIAKKEDEIRKLTLESNKKFAEEVDKENQRIAEAKKETAEISEQIRDINDAEAKKDRARVDADKFDIGGLASAKGVNPRVAGAARDVQNLEEQAKVANANGRPQDAVRFRNQANLIRSRLGAAGLIKSGEYDRHEYPVARPEPNTLAEKLGIEVKPFTKESAFDTMFHEVPITGRDIPAKPWGDTPTQRGLKPFRINDRQLLEPGKRIDGQAPKTIDGYFAAYGVLPVAPKNGV